MVLKENKEHNELLREVRRMCKLAYVLLWFLFVIAVLVWLLSLLVSLFGFVFPQSFTWLGDFEISIPPDVLIFGFLPAVFIGIVVLVLRDISQGETPFSKKQSKRVRLIAYLMFARVVLEVLLFVVIAAFYPDALTSLSYYVSGSSALTVSFDFEALISAIVCYCISLAFEYGALLQRDSDDIV